MNIMEGNFSAEGLRFGIIAARFNEFITNKLVSGAVDALTRHGADEAEITLSWVPGAYEIPLIALKMAGSKKYDAVICLGTVIRGGTPHFEYVAGEVAKGVAQVNMQTGVPTIFGVLTTENIEQAIERAGAKAGNKGFDAAMAAIEMANLMKNLEPKHV